MSIRGSDDTRSTDALIMLDSHLDQMEHVRSILWAMKSLLATNSTSCSTHFELKLLAAVGIRLADDLIEEMRTD